MKKLVIYFEVTNTSDYLDLESFPSSLADRIDHENGGVTYTSTYNGDSVLHRGVVVVKDVAEAEISEVVDEVRESLNADIAEVERYEELSPGSFLVNRPDIAIKLNE